MKIKIEESWKKQLTKEFEKDYFKNLVEFVRSEYKKTTVYPPPKEIFSTFDNCPFDKVKVVILGQDPYHGEGQANGMCFPVHKGIQQPPSLKNIFKEIKDDIGKEIPESGDLTEWGKQGILMMNATLTVRAKSAGSHQKKGWEEFTNAVVQKLSNKREGLVFLLWGNYAKQKKSLIDKSKHLILEAAHPSPFSAYNGFFGCKHFSKTNIFLTKNGEKPINW